MLIDFIPCGKTPRGATLFAQNPGGAPANVLAAVSRLGGSAAFIGCVGEDPFGAFLRETLLACGIDDRSLVVAPATSTTLAFVHLDDRGERSFSFCRSPGADTLLSPGDLPDTLETRILHFGSLSLTAQPAREATLQAVRRARASGSLISFDPNYRAPLWQSESEAVAQMRAAAPLADIIKVSEEELPLLAGRDDPEQGARFLCGAGASLVFVSRGGAGALACCGAACVSLPAFEVPVEDTTGAGDAFVGAALYKLLGKTRDSLRAMDSGELLALCSFAQAAAALSVTRSGAMPAMPSLTEVNDFLRA